MNVFFRNFILVWFFILLTANQAFSLCFELIEVLYPSKHFRQIKYSGDKITLTKGILGDADTRELIFSKVLTKSMISEINIKFTKIKLDKLSSEKAHRLPDTVGILDGKAYYFEFNVNEGESYVSIGSEISSELEEFKNHIEDLIQRQLKLGAE